MSIIPPSLEFLRDFSLVKFMRSNAIEWERRNGGHFPWVFPGSFVQRSDVVRKAAGRGTLLRDNTSSLVQLTVIEVRAPNMRISSWGKLLTGIKSTEARLFQKAGLLSGCKKISCPFV